MPALVGNLVAAAKRQSFLHADLIDSELLQLPARDCVRQLEGPAVVQHLFK